MEMSQEMKAKLCDICDECARFTCSRCNGAHYCSRDHQRIDYSEHKLSCTNYKIVKDESLGEHILASCNIAAGSRILREDPFLIGPLATSDLICLSCSAAITNKDFYKCPDCSWPMCSYECACSEHHLLECDILAQDTTGVGIPSSMGETPRYDLIMTLRGILLQTTNPQAYKCIMQMESHAECRKQEKDPYHDAAVRYFTEVCPVDVDETVIHQVRGAIATNCLVFKSDKNTSIRGLYSTIRLFNHSCIPNVHLTTSKTGEIEARTAVPVKRNSSLCICYTGTMEPLWNRQKYLSEVYKFRCQCQRCSDPTELGTYFSSPKCLDCFSFMVPPGDGGVNSWVCQDCFYKYELIDVKQEVSEWMYHMDMNDVINEKTPRQLAKEMDKFQVSFNDFHYVPLQFTNMLLTILKKPDYETQKLRKEIWENHLKIYNILEPGLTRRRGIKFK